MARTVRSMVLGSLVLAMLACGLPAKSVSPTAPPADAAQPTPSPEPEEPLALSLAEALAGGVEAGTWTESEGIVSGLRYLVGELSPEEAFGATPLLNGEGTGLIRAAQIYLEDIDKVDDREEIERLMAILLPSRATLDRFSQPAVGLRAGFGLASPAARNLGDPAECQALWASGFESPLPLICLEYGQIAVDGRTYRVYYPAYWPEGSPRRSLLQPTLDALADSVRLYNTLGSEPVMSTEIVFTDLDILVEDRASGELLRDPDVYAAALYPIGPDGSSAPDPSETSCRVGVFPSAIEQAAREGEGTLRQTLAHELFHCYEYTNLRFEELAAREAGSQWWVEGAAEFFGSVVYPDVDSEFQYLPRFKSRSSRHSLLDLDYDAYPFFLYLARQRGLGPEGIIELLRQMPERSGGLEAEQQVLAGIPGVEESFHEFGRAYLDRQLEDYSGRRLPVVPNEGPLAAFEIGPGEGFFPATGPFQLKYYRMLFADDTRFRINQTTEGDGKSSARAASAVGAWGRIPSELNTACAEREYLLLVTAAIPPGTGPINLTLTTVGEPVDEEVGCDECLIGTWQLDNSSYLAHMGGLWPLLMSGVASFGLDTGGVESHPTDVFGEMSITFKTDNTANGTQSGWGIAGEAIKDGDVVTASMTYNGGGAAAWRVMMNQEDEQRYLFFDGGEFSLTGQMIFQTFPQRPIPFASSNDSVFLSTPQPFLCTDTTLTYYADDPLGPVIFVRDTEVLAP